MYRFGCPTSVQDHHNEDLRRSNLTSTDLREADFSYTLLNGAYLEKADMYKPNFTGRAPISATVLALLFVSVRIVGAVSELL